VPADALAGAARNCRFLGVTATLLRAVWRPDGKRLASASDDRTVQVYAMEIRDLMALARERVHPSEEGCKKYLHVDKCPPFPELFVK